MIKERSIMVEGVFYTVVISDEQEALLAADAAGRVTIGLWRQNQAGQSLSPAVFVVESMEDADELYLEQVVRRKLGFPWHIAETDRLLLREFCLADSAYVPEEPADQDSDRIFSTPDALEGYIKNQYGFYQYGIWAVVEKESGKLVGKAGVSQMNDQCLGTQRAGLEHQKIELELGYHIFLPYRNQGYGTEACCAIQKYARDRLDAVLYAKIDSSNEASIRLIRSCGFRLIEQRYSEARRSYCLYGWNC